MGCSVLYSPTIYYLQSTTEQITSYSPAKSSAQQQSWATQGPHCSSSLRISQLFRTRLASTPTRERLYSRFSSLDKQDKGYLSREDFLRIPELAINPLGDRIVHAFFFESRSQEEEKVDFKDFVRVLAHFRPIKKNAEKNKLNTRMEKLHFAFRM